MLRRSLTVVSAFVLCGVDAGAQETPPPIVRTQISSEIIRDMRYSDVATFVPAIAAADTGGSCNRSNQTSMMGIPARAYGYRYYEGAKPVRMVTIMLDSLSNLLNYTDLRGALSVTAADMNAGIRRGVTTRIALNNIQKIASVENEVDGKAEQRLFVKPDAFLDAPNLGVPRKMIEMIYAECVQK